MSADALHHLIINLDVQDSGHRTNPGQLILRDVVHGAVQSAFAETGIDQYRLPEDRGDGVLLVLPADVPKELMLGRWVSELREALRGRNGHLKEPIRVRVGIHAGEVTHDSYGVAGRDVNIACRLASCAPAKEALRASPAANMVVTVSDVIYQQVVRHSGRFIEPDCYRQHPLHTAEYDGVVWLYVPGHANSPPPASAPVPPAPPENTPGGIGPMKIRKSGPVVIQSTFRDIKSDRRKP